MTGTLYIVSAPSGGGKTSLIHALVETLPRAELSVSHTTRAPRPGERDGTDYHFVDETTFRSMIAEGAFIEHAEVFDHRYGTSRAAVTERLRAGVDVVLDIDWQGARQVRQSHPDCLSIFILPPSREALLERLRARRQDTEEVIARRMRDAVEEIRHYDEYDYLIVNDEFDVALEELVCLFRAQRLRRPRQVEACASLLDELLALPGDSQ